MKVAYVLSDDIPIYGASGASAHVRNVIEQLKSCGHSVEMIRHGGVNDNDVKDGGSDSDGTSNIGRVVSSLTPTGIIAMLRGWRRRWNNRRLITRNKHVLARSDIVYERDAYQSFALEALTHEADIPWVVECNGIFWDKVRPFPSLSFPDRYRKRHLRKWRRADHLIAVSNTFKEYIVEQGIASDKVSVVPNGTNFQAHQSVPISEVDEFRRRWGLQNEIVLGFLGHMLPWHRIDLLIEAMVQLKRKGHKVHALLVGGGRWKEYRSQSQEMGIDGNMTFTGPLSPKKVPVAVRAMDIGTAPGVYEPGSPLKLFDYGAAKRPVVAADQSSVTEIITHHESGLLFRSGSAEQFAEMASKLIKAKQLQDKLGRNLYRLVKANYTWKKAGRRIEKKLKQVVI